MSISSLSTALTGLKAAQAQINTLSTNIANASTPGYTRKVLEQETRYTSEAGGIGVKLNNIIRKVDMGLLRDIFTQTSRSEQFTTRDTYLSRVTGFHGAAELESSIASEMGRLSDSFAELTVSAEDPSLLNSTLTQAQATARKFNEFSHLLTELRNDTQTELKAIVTETNTILQDIRTLNEQISRQTANGQSPAGLMDQRDEALRALSKNIDISYFKGENNKIFVMTRSGKTLVDDEVRKLSFQPTPIGVDSTVGNGNSAPLTLELAGAGADFDLTAEDIGGKMQALLDLRDETFPQYQAQLDEMAQKTAIRFSQQGLNLFVDRNGSVPASVAPPAPVTYTGFSAEIRVNQNIIDDPTLLRRGTTGETIAPGSNEIIDRIIEFTFGANSHYLSQGSVDISTGTVFAATGLQQQGRVIGDIDLTDFAALTDNPAIAPGAQFAIDTGSGPVAITINAGDTATDLVNNINAAAGAGTARLNGLGQLVFEGNAPVTITDISLGTAGIEGLGHDFGTTAATNPSFTVQVGTQSPVTITIDPADTATDLLADLNAIAGVTASLDGSGRLQISSLDASGVNRGKIQIIDGQGAAAQALGMVTNAVGHDPFRIENLGPDADINSQISGAATLTHFGRSMVAFHAEDHAASTERAERETIFYNTLNERLLNESGVDIDQELSELIRFQTAYTAITQVIRSAEEQFDALINAIR